MFLKYKINPTFLEFKGFPKKKGGAVIWEKFPNNPVIFFDAVPYSVVDKDVLKDQTIHQLTRYDSRVTGVPLV